MGPETAIELNKGPSLAFGPYLHPVLFAELQRVAQEHEIPCQMEVFPSGTGTDANAIQVARAGVPTSLLSIPLRNMHTPIETLSVKDVLRTGRLMAYTIAGLDEGFFKRLVGQIEGAGA